MKKDSFNPIIIGKPLAAIKLPSSGRNFDPTKPVVPPIDPDVAMKLSQQDAGGQDHRRQVSGHPGRRQARSFS